MNKRESYMPGLAQGWGSSNAVKVWTASRCKHRMTIDVQRGGCCCERFGCSVIRWHEQMGT